MSVEIRECLCCGHSRYTCSDVCPVCFSTHFVKKDGEGLCKIWRWQIGKYMERDFCNRKKIISFLYFFLESLSLPLKNLLLIVYIFFDLCEVV